MIPRCHFTRRPPCVSQLSTIVIILTLLHAVPAPAGLVSEPSSVGKGVLLVAHPSLNDPNFRHTVILIVAHGSEGTLGFILNRSTNILLSEALPEVTVLKGTAHRLFAGGPVMPNRILLLYRLRKPRADLDLIFNGVYMGGTSSVLEHVVTEPKPNETFRAFAGFAGWAPGQLEAEMLQGAWAILPPDSFSIFDKDPASLGSDSLSRLQTPQTISNEWGAGGVMFLKWVNVKNGCSPVNTDQLLCSE